MNDYYCNQKFWWLNVDLEKHQQYSCCSATPSDIDFSWLERNTGKIFNTPLLQEERTMMLSNLPVNSCQDTCFIPESRGLTSRRLFENGRNQTHIDITATPTTLNIVMGSTCNLTCVYCCKQYSSAWLRDIQQHGPYLDHNRYRVFPIDLAKKHSQTRETKEYKLLENELFAMTLDSVHISGGEPFLYNNLTDIVTNLKATEIRINTGLGVDPVRFKNQLDKIKHITNLKVLISVETQNELYEFIRFGNSYQNFEKNLQTVLNSGVKYQLVSVVSNVTILGLLDLYTKDHPWHFLLCGDPDYLAINVMDNTTKQTVIQKLENSSIPIRNELMQNLQVPYTEDQHKNCSSYLNEFAKRRNLSLNVLPQSFHQWIQNVVQ